jgi:hypothetical protein
VLERPVSESLMPGVDLDWEVCMLDMVLVFRLEVTMMGGRTVRPTCTDIGIGL